MLWQMQKSHSFLWPGDLPLYVCMYFFFINSSFDGHLDCFHILGFVNNASVNTVVDISFQISVFVFVE